MLATRMSLISGILDGRGILVLLLEKVFDNLDFRKVFKNFSKDTWGFYVPSVHRRYPFHISPLTTNPLLVICCPSWQLIGYSIDLQFIVATMVPPFYTSGGVDSAAWCGFCNFLDGTFVGLSMHHTVRIKVMFF